MGSGGPDDTSRSLAYKVGIVVASIFLAGGIIILLGLLALVVISIFQGIGWMLGN